MQEFPFHGLFFFILPTPTCPTPSKKFFQGCSCEHVVAARLQQRAFYLWSPRHFVNLDVTHGRLRILVCHNGL